MLDDGGDGVDEVMGTPEVGGRGDGLGAGPEYRDTHVRGGLQFHYLTIHPYRIQ